MTKAHFLLQVIWQLLLSLIPKLNLLLPHHTMPTKGYSAFTPLLCSLNGNRNHSEPAVAVNLLTPQLCWARLVFGYPLCGLFLVTVLTILWVCDRFCQECIVTALRSGNKECPTCRKKLVSKRSLRPDPNFDALINKIYPNRDDYNAHQEHVLAARLRHSANPGAVLAQRLTTKPHRIF